MHIIVKITVKGLVQGVGYRYFCYRKAVEYNINGYAKNMFDGSVEVVASGEKNLVKDFTKELKRGPFNSYVKSINVEEISTDASGHPETEYKDFKMY